MKFYQTTAGFCLFTQVMCIRHGLYKYLQFLFLHNIQPITTVSPCEPLKCWKYCTRNNLLPLFNDYNTSTWSQNTHNNEYLITRHTQWVPDHKIHTIIITLINTVNISALLYNRICSLLMNRVSLLAIRNFYLTLKTVLSW